MSVGILGTSWDQCVSMVHYCFTSTESIRLVWTESPGRPPRLFTQLILWHTNLSTDKDPRVQNTSLVHRTGSWRRDHRESWRPKVGSVLIDWNRAWRRRTLTQTLTTWLNWRLAVMKIKGNTPSSGNSVLVSELTAASLADVTESVALLALTVTPVSYTHLTLPTRFAV